jgi:hypothetical protein
MRLMVAGSLGAVVLAWFAGSTWFGGGSAEVPVVQAESGPMRVKPANPGGLQVPGADNAIFSSNGGTGGDRLAPPPQTPDLQALQAPPPPAPAPKPAEPAKLAAAPPPPSPAEHGAEPAKPSAATTALKPPATMAAMTPPVRAAAPKAAVGTAASKPAPAADIHPSDALATDHRPTPPAMAVPHGALVQLGALSSEQAAHEEWGLLAKRLPQLLLGRQPSVSRVERDGHTYWRLRTGGFADTAQATTFCLRMRAKGASCSVADF